MPDPTIHDPIDMGIAARLLGRGRDRPPLVATCRRDGEPLDPDWRNVRTEASNDG